MCPAHALFGVLRAAVLLFMLPSAVAAQWITFDAAPGETGVAGSGASPVRGYLSIPLEPGRHPAVVLLASCEGSRPFHQTWAQVLSERGFVALLVDDFFMQDRGRACGLSDPVVRAEVLEQRVQAARGAARYLAAHARVDHARVAVMGWGDAPLHLLGDGHEDAGPHADLFAAAVAMSPMRCFEDTGGSRPLLVLRSQGGARAGDQACAAQADAPAREIKVYPGTRPGFDDPEALAHGVSQQGRYDRLAHLRAIEDVTAFLHRRLPSLRPHSARASASGAQPAPFEAGTWAVDPHDPGPDLPPAGGSAFDAVFSRETPGGVVHDIPFPFSSLLRRLALAAGAQQMTRSPLDATLIPLGRSLQREAAAPEYFTSPRLVVAVTGAPGDGVGPLGVKLENRLFLGYQPQSDVLEIISYNDAAARFEFQVVRGYGSEQAPSARYARRALCLSCHQNAAPIFAEASWGETLANAQIARRLQALGPDYHGVAVGADDGAVVAIDIATGQANVLPVYQRLWSQGCASDNARELAACRAGALQAMLQYRLSDAAGFDRHTPLYAGAYLPLQRRNWRSRWPQGLLIPNPNIPDRTPLMWPTPSLVPAALDPLRARPPSARWQAASARDLERLVRGLSHELPDRHVTLLDRHLREAGEGAPGRALQAPCQVIRRGFPGRARLYQITCDDVQPRGAGFGLRAQLQVSPDGLAQGSAALELDEGRYARRVVSGRATEEARIVLRWFDTDGATPIRAPDGNTIKEFVLTWMQDLPESATRIDATGTLTVSGDFRPLAALIARLASDPAPGSPLTADRFDGVRLSGWLLAELGVLPGRACCTPRAVPAPRVAIDAPDTDAVLSVDLEHRGALQTFNRYCGACHGGDTHHPPGFLHGSGEALLRAVASCAERIYYRLSMWQLPAGEQAVPPMPPLQGLGLAGTTVDAWRRSESLARLTAHARALIAGQNRDPGDVLAARYHAARPCLAGAR